MQISDLPPQLQRRLQAELKAGESLSWIGQPNPKQYMKSGFKSWGFYIPWTAFSLFWIAVASGFKFSNGTDGWNLFPLLGVPFLIIGLGGLSSPFWLHRKAGSIVYAITNQRAISIEGERSTTVKSYRASDITSIERIEHPDGSGDLILQTERYRDNDGDQHTRQHGFFAIDQVKQAERFIASLRVHHA